jgi:methionine biosynthesis protein MetW
MAEKMIYKFSDEPTGTHALLTGYIQPNNKVLDIGCAGGYLGEKLIKEKNCEVWGIEPEKKYYEEALNKGYKIVFNKKIEEALESIQNEKFDYILAGDVLEHLERPGKILLSLSNFLKDNGRFVISLPNIAHYSVRFGLLSGKWDMHDAGILDKTHLHFYTLKSANELLNNAGWKVVSMRPRGDLERWFRKIGLEWVGRKLLFLWPRLFAVQFIFIAEKEKI